MFLRILLLVSISSIPPCFAAETDPESLARLTPQKAIFKCKDEYCCMLGRGVQKCLRSCIDCTCEGCNACLDESLPWRYEDQEKRTACVECCLNNASCYCFVTGAIGAGISAIVLGFTSLICGCESLPAAYACIACEGCGALMPCGGCLVADGYCPLAYCCENCFNLNKLDSGSGNSQLRNLVTGTRKRD